MLSFVALSFGSACEEWEIVQIPLDFFMEHLIIM